MPTPEERLALVLEASDKATAILQKVRKEIEDTRDAAKASGKASGESADEVHRLGESSTSVRRLGREMSGVAFAINDARLGSKSAVLEIASMAGTAAETSVAFAAWAPLIGGAVALLGTALAIVQDTKREEERLNNFRDHLHGKSLDQLRQIRDETRQANEHALTLIDESQVGLLAKAAGYLDLLTGHVTAQSTQVAAQHGALDELGISTKENEEATKAATAAERAERMRLIMLHEQSDEMVRQKSLSLETSRAQLATLEQRGTSAQAEAVAARAALSAQNQSVIAMFRHRDESGQIVALTAREVADRARLLGLNQQAYAVAVATATVREKQRTLDATFDITARIAALTVEQRMEQGHATTIDAQRTAAYTAYQREIVQIQRAGYSAEFRANQEARVLQLYQGQIALIDQIVARQERTAHADRLAGSGDIAEQYRGRLEQIQLEKEAQIQAGVSVAEAERTAQQKIRQARGQVYHDTLANLKSIEDATLSSHNRTVRAIGLAANTLRRLAIGAEASLALVESARAFAKVPGYLAGGNPVSAALSAASGVQLAAAAALGFRESLGGGGSGGGAGDVGSAGGGSTFQPSSSSESAQPLVVNLYTLHPSDPQLVQSVAFELKKGELLKRPDLPTPPAVTLGASVGRAA